MVVLMVLLTIVVFIIIDVLSRIALKRYQEAKSRKEREEALDIGLRLDYSAESPSLKRVEVENPKARILAVDDEAIVLDSFRKILVIAGYSIDTVESGPEALGLVREREYDFVFTDLKMPDMDGLDVTKTVKYLRPDIDVIIITGYATIETAVAAMKYGAMDYVQKPFTADELVEFANKLVIRRQDRLERQMRPKVQLVTPSTAPSGERHTFNVPAGAFIAPSHTWLTIGLNGMVVVGVDDFAQKLIEKIDAVEIPAVGSVVKKGDPLFSVHHGSRVIPFPSPVSGRITALNEHVRERPDLVRLKPYDLGWICRIEPSRLSEEVAGLRIGADAVGWYQEEIDRYFEMMRSISGAHPEGDSGHGDEVAVRKAQMEEERLDGLEHGFIHV